MKRFILFLLIAVMLVGCGKQEPTVETEPPQTTLPTTEATEPTTEATEPTTQPTTEPTTAPTEPPVIYRHPLTGQAMESPFTGYVTAVVINNIKACQPQFGVSKADIFYEMEAEGGITRNLALFTNLDDVETIGPIRSLRTYFATLACAYDAPIAHCSGSKVVKAGYADDYRTKLPFIRSMDSTFNGKYFFRDESRINQGYAYEHTLFTTGEKLKKLVEAKDFDKTYPDGLDLGLQFADIPALDGSSAEKITVDFYGNKTSTFTFDSEYGLYKKDQYGGKHVDAYTGKTLTFRNVIALYADQQKVDRDGTVRSYYDLLGSGSGHLACDGKIIPIQWHHEAYEDPFTYTLEDGTPVTLGVGKTYIAITSTGPVEFE